jgi:alpha-beta hydrolase superfamily lysophospholipase
MTTSLASELIRAVERTSRSAARVRVPILMLHGEEDPICPASGTRRFFEGLGVEPRRLQIYPGLLHEIFNEPEHVRVFEDVLAIKANRGAAGCKAFTDQGPRTLLTPREAGDDALASCA